MVKIFFKKLKIKSYFLSNSHQYWACCFGQKADKLFFFSNRNFIAVQIFTRPISSPPAGTLRFAQSPLRGLAIKQIVCVYVCMSVFIFTHLLINY